MQLVLYKNDNWFCFLMIVAGVSPSEVRAWSLIGARLA